MFFLFFTKVFSFVVSKQRTYVQRYWVNKDFWKSPDGPVFLYIGGEGGIDESTFMGGEDISWFNTKYN